jgi:hypothetical protein
VRSRAKEFEVSPDRIGMMGFSAVGHLASTAATHYDGGNPGTADSIDQASRRPVLSSWDTRSSLSKGPTLTAVPARICSATIRIRSWFRSSPTNCKSLPRLRPHSYSPRVKTRRCPRKTV